MKLECVQQKLLDAVLIAEKTTSKNTTLPVLGCLLFEATKGELKVKATNLDLGIEIKVAAKVEKEGKVAVPGSVFQNVLSASGRSTKISFEVKEGNVVVSTDSGQSIVKAVPHDDFPSLPKVDNGATFDIPSEPLRSGLQSVSFSASQSTVKPELASVYVYQRDKKLYFVATDSFRLAEKIVPLNGLPDFDPLLIPARNVVEIIKTLDYIGDTDIQMSLNENQVSFSHDSVFLTSRLIDGTFPDYRQIVPKSHETEVVLLKQDFSDALKKANIFSDKFNQLHFAVEETGLNLSSSNSDTGETNETLQATVKGSPVEINFNQKYIADSLSIMKGDSLSIELNGLGKPLVMRSVSDNSFLYLVMPMNR